MIKKILIFTSICMSVLVSAVYASGNENELLKSEEYGLVCAISDAEKYMPHSDEYVKRSEFVPAFVSALGLESISGTELEFSDVERGSDIYNMLSAAVGMSFVNNSQFFRPDDAITLNEALKICVTATGYGIDAEYEGGYPDGYIAIANRLGITQGIYANDVLSTAEAYRLIYNTFEADYLIKENDGYTRGEGDVLEVYHDMRLIKGIVTSNEITETGGYVAAATEPDELNGTIGIDYKLYSVEGDYNAFLGYAVRAYVAGDADDEQTVVYVHPESLNTEVEFVSNDMYFEKGYIYRESEHRKHYELSKSAEIIYNGRVIYDYDLTSLNNICGSVRLINNNDDREYDYVIVNDYYYMQVASFDIDDMIIRDKYDAGKEIVIEDKTVYSIYDDEKQQYTDLGAIEQGRLLAVKKSDDGNVIDIVAVGKILSGTLGRYSDEEIIINGEKYIPSDYFIANDMKKLRGGKDIDLYLGINNEIVAISYVENVMQYGYLVNAYLDDSNTMLGMRIFNQKGNMEKYWCEEKIICDGKKSDIRTVLTTIQSRGTRQLIKFSLNAEGKVKNIDLSSTSNSYIDERNINNSNDCLTRHSFASSYYYRAATFYPHFNIQNTLIFRVPTEGSDEEAFAIGYTFTDGDIADSQIEIYDVGLDGTAEALVVYADNDATTINRVSPKIILVEKVYKEIDDNDEEMVTITGWENGVFKKHYIKEDVEILKNRQTAEIESGDILRFTENEDGVITAAVVEFIGSKRVPNDGDNLGYFNIRSTDCHYQVGSVYSLENSWALISNVPGENGYSYDGNMINVKIPDNIAIYNETTRKIRTGTKDDIKTYLNSNDDASYVLVKQYYGTSNFCVVFEK